MPNDVPTDFISLTYKDYSREKSTVEVNTRVFADFSTYGAARNAYVAATDAITDGLRQQNKESLTSRVSNQPSEIADSAREKKVLVRYEDTVTFQIYTVTVPTFDDDACTFITNTDFLDLTQEPIAAYVAAFESFVASPDGNNVNVISMERVGRAN